MKLLLSAIALTIALPAVAHAETAPPTTPAPAAKMECCCEKMGKPMKCCKEHSDRQQGGDDAHDGHDMSGH